MDPEDTGIVEKGTRQVYSGSILLCRYIYIYNSLYIYIHPFIVFIEKIRILICNLLYLIVVGRRGEERGSLSQLPLFPIVATTRDNSKQSRETGEANKCLLLLPPSNKLI
mgnify:CR=1 FL=1